MKIINETKNIILAENAILAETFFKRIKGLLGRKFLGDKEALIIKPCNSIHTFFMAFPIDVLFVDKNNRVIKVIISFQPFRLSPICTSSAYVIECAPGVSSPDKVEVGDRLLIQ
jgi:uncharacterized protein